LILIVNFSHDAVDSRLVNSGVRRRMATIRVRLDSEDQMKRVTGIGDIFFSAKDPKALCAWYKTGVVQPLIGPTPTAIRPRELRPG
jgi:hypothetical protein